MYIRQELECNGIPVFEYGFEEEVLEDDAHEDEPAHQPTPTCGQCEHFYQSKHQCLGLLPHISAWGYCPILDAEQRMSDTPCRLYKEDCPF